MRNRAAVPVLDFLTVEPRGGAPLYHQIYTELRNGILKGRLPDGTRLPSSREVADTLSISRRPVREAYAFLLSEGLLVSRRGAGTFVRQPPTIAPVPVPREGDATPPDLRLSMRGRALAATPNYETRATGAFAPTLPAADQFPKQAFARLLARRWRDAEAIDFRKAPAAGLSLLREAIAGYLATTRGLMCSPEQVLVTAGSTHAIGLLARLLLNPGERAWIENPGWPTGRQTLAANQVETVPVPVDREGLDVEAGRLLAPDARLALVTPTRQYPLGMGLSLGRRTELLTWAQDQLSWIVEDDYDGEFQYATRVLPPLQTLDGHGRVIYMGSFSKVLTQALRIGYLVLPPALVEPMSRVLSHEKTVPTLAQAALADFLTLGEFARHVRRMRSLYRARRDALVAALRLRFDDSLELTVGESGFHILATMPPGTDETVVSRRCAELGVYAPALGDFYHSLKSRAWDGAPGPTLVLGFACVHDAEMRRGIDGLGQALTPNEMG